MSWLSRLFRRAPLPEQAFGAAVEGAKKALGQDFVGALAYGSFVSGEYVHGHSDLNLMVVARRLDADQLGRLAPVVSHWKADLGLKPLVFSMGELKAFAEAFPMEFGDIAENRRLLSGEDPFLRLQVPQGRLADELEAEIRNRLVKLRQRYMLSGGADLRPLLSAAAGSIFTVLRAFLRLKHRRPPRQRVRLIEEACRNYRFSRRTLLQAHDLRYGRKNAERIDAAELFGRMLHELEQMADLAARMRGESRPEGAGGERGEREGRGDRGERGGERGERGDRDRGMRRRSDSMRAPLGGGDRSGKLAQVRNLIQEASSRKKWEPKDPERFLSDEFSRDLSLSFSARFGWDRAWQPERKAKGYVAPVAPVEEADDDDEDFSDSALSQAPAEGEAGEAAGEAAMQAGPEALEQDADFDEPGEGEKEADDAPPRQMTGPLKED